MAIKKTLPAFCMFLFVLISLAVFGGGKAEAKYEKSAMTTLEQQKNMYMSYLINVLHKAEMTQGDLFVRINENLKFSYSPELSFNAYNGGVWDSPYGSWIESVSDMKKYYCGYETLLPIIDYHWLRINAPSNIGPGNLYAYVTVAGIEPKVSMVSSDSAVIECNSMSCIAKKAGKVTLTVNSSTGKISVSGTECYSPSWSGGPWKRGGTSASLDFPDTLSWDVNVLPNVSCIGTNPANATLCAGDDQLLVADTAKSAVSSCSETQKCEYICNSGYNLENGACVLLTTPVVPTVAPPVLIPSSGACGGDVDGKTFCQTPSRSKLCSAGSTASVVTLADGKWTWTCTGSDKVKIPCSAIKNCAWTEVNP